VRQQFKLPCCWVYAERRRCHRRSAVPHSASSQYTWSTSHNVALCPHHHLLQLQTPKCISTSFSLHGTYCSLVSAFHWLENVDWLILGGYWKLSGLLEKDFSCSHVCFDQCQSERNGIWPKKSAPTIQTALLLSSQIKYPNFVCLLLATLPHHLHTYLLLLLLPLIMVALCNRADHYIFALWFLSSSFFFYFLA